MRLFLSLHKVLFASAVLLTAAELPAQEIPVLFPQPLSPRIANYNIDVRLDVAQRRLTGQQILVWRNATSRPATELQFHLYLNAFRNSESTFMRESGGLSRGNRIGKDGWGYSEVKRLVLAYGRELGEEPASWLARPPTQTPPGARDLTAQLEFIQPDDGNEHDKTVFRVPLPRPLPPGESVVVQMAFDARLPSPPFARTGAKKEYFFVAQWFPKIGVYTEAGWNCHQFHANSEFFADYGVYNVRMTVPVENIVGATGIEVDVRDNGDGTATHFYHAEDVHDFAWTTSPEFRVFTTRVHDVDVRVLLQPDHVAQAERHLTATRLAVEYFQNWFGDYPFPNLTVVDPRRGAEGSGGMEYPTLITAGTSYGLPEGVRTLEMVIIHEFGHNFWYHLLASNEFEEAWLDEGVNTYTDIQILSDIYGPEADILDFLGVKATYRQLMRGNYLFYADLDQIITRAWEFYDGNSYGVNSYAKPGLVLTTLQNYLGKDVMRKAMRTYVERWRFKHPTSDDFFAVVEEVAGQDLDWFFDQAFRSNAVLDYSVSSVTTREIKPARGYDFSLTVTSDDSAGTNGQEVAARPDTTDRADTTRSEAKPGKRYRSVVTVRRLGAFKFPVEVEFGFADGETVRKSWDGQGYWARFEFERPARLVYATVDPDRKIVMDVNFSNNSRTVKTQWLGLNKLSVRWLFWMQFLLEQPDFANVLMAIASLLN